MKSYLPFFVLFISASTWYGLPKMATSGEFKELSREEREQKTVELGKFLFFDENLSNPRGKSCASCHSPNSGFADPTNSSVSEGVFKLKGHRNTPTAAYMAYSPDFAYNPEEENYFGGQFWDGRAKDLCEQAKGPLLNHIEMNNSSKRMVVETVKNSSYSDLFLSIYGKNAFSDIDQAFNNIAEAIEAYEKSNEFNPFSSKFDLYLQGKATLTALEQKGLKLFNNPKKGNCAACHLSTADEHSGKVLFTDFTYDNLGVPSSNLNPLKKPDFGLGKTVNRSSENGKFKVPTLRNIALTAPYFHNGTFKTLEEVVDFYANRDTGKYGPPEVAENVNHDELGKLPLNEEDIKAIVAFMHTLTDGYQATKK